MNPLLAVALLVCAEARIEGPGNSSSQHIAIRPHNGSAAQEHKQVAQQLAPPEIVWASSRDALLALVNARKLGPHIRRGLQPLQDALGNVISSAPKVDWVFLAVSFGLLLHLDVLVLQELPETPRTHVLLLSFWMLAGVAMAVEIYLSLGDVAGTAWLVGYLLELIYSLDYILVAHLIFSALETPRRLTGKALFLTLLACACTRFLFAVGLAQLLDNLRIIPYAVGALLIYCGTQQLSSHEEVSDVTQNPIVRAASSLLGRRLGMFYDEDGEGVLAESGGTHCITLLAVVVASLLSADAILNFDVALVKSELLPNAYVDFSSSVMALFVVRALFSVARDVFSTHSLTRWGVGLAILFLGSEMLLGRSLYINAIASFTCISLIVLSAIALSILREPMPKVVF